MLTSNLLSILVWLPVVGGLLVLALGDARIAAGRWTALAVALATFLLSIPLYTGFDGSTASFQFTERAREENRAEKLPADEE